VQKRIPTFPKVIEIETTNICNAKCIICPNKDMKRRREIMDFGLFKKIIDECRGKNVSVIHPFITGEPLVIRDICMYLEYMKEAIPNVGIELFSNGSLLTRELSQKLIQEKLVNGIVISLEGGTKELYEKTRLGLSFDTLKKNISDFLEIRNEVDGRMPSMGLNVVITKENRDQLQLIEKEFGNVDYVHYSVLYNWAGYFPLPKIGRRNNSCFRLNEWMSVLWDGRICLCCMDYEGTEIIGDLRESNIEDIWNGRRLAEIRDLLKKRKFNELKLCSQCGMLAHPAFVFRIQNIASKYLPYKMYAKMEKLYKTIVSPFFYR
jgi:MoaA/NifB/PqqE/SkfB family radical SAM enzyme